MNIYTIIAFIAALSVGGSQAFQAVYRKTPVAVLALGAQPGCPEAGLEAGRVDGRRAFLWTTVLSSSALVANTFLPLPAIAAATVNYKAVAKDITDMVKQDPDKVSDFVPSKSLRKASSELVQFPYHLILPTLIVNSRAGTHVCAVGMAFVGNVRPNYQNGRIRGRNDPLQRRTRAWWQRWSRRYSRRMAGTFV